MFFICCCTFTSLNLTNRRDRYFDDIPHNTIFKHSYLSLVNDLFITWKLCWSLLFILIFTCLFMINILLPVVLEYPGRSAAPPHGGVIQEGERGRRRRCGVSNCPWAQEGHDVMVMEQSAGFGRQWRWWRNYIRLDSIATLINIF